MVTIGGGFDNIDQRLHLLDQIEANLFERTDDTLLQQIRWLTLRANSNPAWSRIRKAACRFVRCGVSAGRAIAVVVVLVWGNARILMRRLGARGVEQSALDGLTVT